MLMTVGFMEVRNRGCEPVLGMMYPGTEFLHSAHMLPLVSHTDLQFALRYDFLGSCFLSFHPAHQIDWWLLPVFTRCCRVALSLMGRQYDNHMSKSILCIQVVIACM